jgi:hypothetical protein
MLKSVRLVNCQSIKDITFNFATDRLNVIAANNSVGKSVLFKMLKITADPKQLPTIEERSQLIRHGAESAIFVAAFSDGAIGLTVVYPNRVIYRYAQLPELGFDTFAEPPEIYLKQLGLLIDERTKYVATIIDTDQDMLFINSDQRGNDALLQLIAENPIIAQEKEKFKNLEVTSSKLLLNSNAALIDCQQNLKNFEYVDESKVQDQIDRAEACSMILHDLIKINSEVITVGEYLKDFPNYDEYLQVVDLAIYLQSIQSSLNSIAVCNNKILDILNILLTLVELKQNIESICVITDQEKLDCFLLLIKLFGNLEFCLKKVVNMDIVSEDITDILKSLSSLSYNERSLTQSLNALDQANLKIDSIMDEIKRSGRELDCPIHGKVVYNGEQCIPYNF